MLEALEEALKSEDAKALQLALFDLGQAFPGEIPDHVSFGIIDILQRDQMFSSELSGHLLTHFQFHRERLSSTAKERCIDFIREFGKRFTDAYSIHVIAELREGRYLDTPNDGFLPPRRKPRRDG